MTSSSFQQYRLILQKLSRLVLGLHAHITEIEMSRPIFNLKTAVLFLVWKMCRSCIQMTGNKTFGTSKQQWSWIFLLRIFPVLISVSLGNRSNPESHPLSLRGIAQWHAWKTPQTVPIHDLYSVWLLHLLVMSACLVFALLKDHFGQKYIFLEFLVQKHPVHTMTKP